MGFLLSNILILFYGRFTETCDKWFNEPQGLLMMVYKEHAPRNVACMYTIDVLGSNSITLVLIKLEIDCGRFVIYTGKLVHDEFVVYDRLVHFNLYFHCAVIHKQ